MLETVWFIRQGNITKDWQTNLQIKRNLDIGE